MVKIGHCQEIAQAGTVGTSPGGRSRGAKPAAAGDKVEAGQEEIRGMWWGSQSPAVTLQGH